MGAAVAVRRIGDDAAAPRRNGVSGKKIHAGLAKAAVHEVGRDHIVAVAGQDGGHCPVAATRLPDRAAKANVSQQRLGDPGGRRIKILARPLIARNMDRSARVRPKRFDCRWFNEIGNRQSRLKECHARGFRSVRLPSHEWANRAASNCNILADDLMDEQQRKDCP